MVCFLAACLSGCGQGGGPTAALSPEALYRLHCSRCHGDGSGNGHIAGTLKVAPRNLKHSDWQTAVTDDHIRQVIESGGGAVKLSPEMPAFADKLTPRQIQQLVGYIRRLGRY
ncbi:MAG: cytochrome c [bacterium]|nr:cytochrome c [bacterium]